MNRHENLTIDKEIAYWRLVSLNSMKAVTGMNSRLALEEQPLQQDFALRDMYVSGLWPEGIKIGKYRKNKGMDQLKVGRGLNMTQYEESERENLFIEKYEFWRKVLKMSCRSKEEVESQKIVQRQMRHAAMLPFFCFMTATVFILRVTGTYRLPGKTKLFSTAVAALYTYIWTVSRQSKTIFDNLPELPDQALEKRRMQLKARGLILDAGFLEIFNKTKVQQELAAQVENEPDQEIREKMYEMIGYKVYK